MTNGTVADIAVPLEVHPLFGPAEVRHALSKALASDQVETNRGTAPRFETKSHKISKPDSSLKLWYPGGIQVDVEDNGQIFHSINCCFLL
ncbi:hypothetical protein [Aquidulcibacter paucihalophilus]|uniref:hypothetical protein n=1 Tax=Aquidulcibacter paucihalophilus TaxID=1978549 RepID=UPI000A19675D|nr:hypothetical protein [Aquidulcibacter paucihalophilus]